MLTMPFTICYCQNIQPKSSVIDARPVDSIAIHVELLMN